MTGQNLDVPAYIGSPWNGSAFFNSDEYKNRTDRSFWNWKDYHRTWDGKQLVIWSLYALSGVAHGAREAYHADPEVFEKLYGVHQNHFFGSEAWIRNYHDNQVAKGHKSEAFGNIGRDFWHTADEFDIWPMGAATLSIGMRKHPRKFKLVNMVLGMGARTLFAMVTYNTLRHVR